MSRACPACRLDFKIEPVANDEQPALSPGQAWNRDVTVQLQLAEASPSVRLCDGSAGGQLRGIGLRWADTRHGR